MPKRVAVAVALALFVLGCGGPGDRVPLITGIANSAGGGCFTSGIEGQLVVDPNGTAILQTDGGSAMPVAWRPGFIGRRVGSEIVVLDPDGHEVARTGRTYRMDGGSVIPDTFSSQLPSGVGMAFWACDRVIPQQ